MLNISSFNNILYYHLLINKFEDLNILDLFNSLIIVVNKILKTILTFVLSYFLLSPFLSPFLFPYQ